MTGDVVSTLAGPDIRTALNANIEDISGNAASTPAVRGYWQKGIGSPGSYDAVTFGLRVLTFIDSANPSTKYLKFSFDRPGQMTIFAWNGTTQFKARVPDIDMVGMPGPHHIKLEGDPEEGMWNAFYNNQWKAGFQCSINLTTLNTVYLNGSARQAATRCLVPAFDGSDRV